MGFQHSKLINLHKRNNHEFSRAQSYKDLRKYHQRVKKAQNNFAIRSQDLFCLLNCGYILNSRSYLFLDPGDNCIPAHKR